MPDLRRREPVKDCIARHIGATDPLLGGEIEPDVSLHVVGFDADARAVQAPQLQLRQSVSSLRRPSQPFRSPPVTLGAPLAVEQSGGQRILRVEVPVRRGAFKRSDAFIIAECGSTTGVFPCCQDPFCIDAIRRFGTVAPSIRRNIQRSAFRRSAEVGDCGKRADTCDQERSHSYRDDREARTFRTDCPEDAAALAASLPGMKRVASVVVVLPGS